MAVKIVHVAVGAIVSPDGKILIARRAADAHQGGLWEFPGGKVDAGETIHQALQRELYEELDIQVEQTEPLIQIRHDYVDKSVFLDVYKVLAFSGEPRGVEGQPVRWVTVPELSDYPFPAANKPIITALQLPDSLLITGDFDSPADFLFRLERALQRGVRLVQLRCLSASLEQFRDLAQLAKTLCEQYQTKLLCNTTLDNFFQCAGDGLHLNSHELRRYESRPIDDSKLLGASCHNAEEILQALRIGADYVCLSPVAPTSSHPNAAVLGWEKFAELVQNTGVPVFALGGMDGDDIEIAKAHGGQGIAAISCFWNK